MDTINIHTRRKMPMASTRTLSMPMMYGVWSMGNNGCYNNECGGDEDEETLKSSEDHIVIDLDSNDVANDDMSMNDEQTNNDQQLPQEDPNKQGAIRNVKNAHLVYKRQNDQGLYEEMWLFNISTSRDSYKIRNEILAGTDIDPQDTCSEDGTQTYELWSIGNAQIMVISGLSN